MTVVKPSIKLTIEEVKAIDKVIELCDKLRDLNGDFLSMVFDENFMDESFADVVSTLRDVLDCCEYAETE